MAREEAEEEEGERRNIFLQRWQRTSKLDRERRRQKEGGKWVGMSPFILPLLPPLMPVESCHFVRRLIRDTLVQELAAVDCVCAY